MRSRIARDVLRSTSAPGGIPFRATQSVDWVRLADVIEWDNARRAAQRAALDEYWADERTTTAIRHDRSPGRAEAARPERAFLDANVILGQQTTDVLLSLAAEGVYEPRWTEQVIDEMRRNRPPGALRGRTSIAASRIDEERPPWRDGREPPQGSDRIGLQADPKDKHVLSRCR